MEEKKLKILMITPYVTIAGRPEFERNKTGFGYMVHGIAMAVGALENVDVLATDSRGFSFDEGGVHYLKRSLWLFARNVFKTLPLKCVKTLINNYSMKKGSRIRLWYYWLMTGYVNQIISEGNYDLVHIHGCAYSDDFWMELCKKKEVKFIVTLHGLNSFSDTIRVEEAGKKYERDFLQRVVDGEMPITVISSGIKRTIQTAYHKGDCNNIKVICNSFKIDSEENINICVREMYGIPKEGNILLYVGNISENKNQRQMVDAYYLLPECLRKNIWILFCGSPSADGRFEKEIRNSADTSHIILCGCVDRKVIGNYFREADGVVLLSKAEGFGLSLIEGMHFGVPCAMFSDMGAFTDIYNSCAVVSIDERSDYAVASAIEKLLRTSWNKESIIGYSQRFSSEEMAKNYIKAYQDE